MATPTIFDPQEVVKRYFEHIHDLRSGQSDAVGELVDLWDDDGVFEFAGSPPMTGTFRGKNAIHVLYKNRLAASGMPLKLTGTGLSPAASAVAPEVALGLVDTQINRMRTLAAQPESAGAEDGSHRVAVGWTTIIGTDDRRGFQVTGNHAFTFKNGKISSLKVTVSPRADNTQGLSLQGLAVSDIGRLSLAAWAVV